MSGGGEDISWLQKPSSSSSTLWHNKLLLPDPYMPSVNWCGTVWFQTSGCNSGLQSSSVLCVDQPNHGPNWSHGLWTNTNTRSTGSKVCFSAFLLYLAFMQDLEPPNFFPATSQADGSLALKEGTYCGTSPDSVGLITCFFNISNKPLTLWPRIGSKRLKICNSVGESYTANNANGMALSHCLGLNKCSYGTVL